MREKNGARHRTHGLFGTPMNRLWAGMLARCRNPRARGYHRYGGRGIKVCERWLKFENFLADVGPRPSKEHSLGRRDNDGDYEPSNVRWETRDEQANTRSTCKFITYGGKTMTLAHWAREIRVKPSTLGSRLHKGMTEEEALTYSKSSNPYTPEPRVSLRGKRRVQLFLDHDGVCVICKGKIDGVKERWIDEHIIPLSRGGTNDLSNRGPAHEKCAIEKTKTDVKGLAKDRRIYSKHIGAKKSAKPMAGSRSSPWKKKMDGTVERRRP